MKQRHKNYNFECLPNSVARHPGLLILAENGKQDPIIFERKLFFKETNSANIL